MSDYYSRAKEVACHLGYTEFTALQERAFTEEQIFSDTSQWVFVTGKTSSGKTLIPLMSYFVQYMQGKKLRMLFAVPYRALASQKYEEISSVAKKLGLDLKVEISTGEMRSADTEIRFGRVDIAVIIYEKIFMFTSMDKTFLSNYQLLVMDEIGLTQDIARGLKADFIMARAKMYKNLKVIALGTPYYDWSLYVKSFGFIDIEEKETDERPVKLKTFPVYVSGKTTKWVDHVEEECYAVTEGQLVQEKNKQGDPNPHQWTDKIIEDICMYHLKIGHKILIFINNREEVHRLSQRLCDSLVRQGSLSRWIEKDKISEYIFEKVHLEEDELEDDLYGILEKEDYEAFSYGVGYHNSTLPLAMRTLVEKEILGESGNLQIVCCTETLAYGINSNVDVVIIPNMIKQRTEEVVTSSFLKANEYMNYAGRAGRLHPGSTGDQVGYVYPIIRAKYKNRGEEDLIDQHMAWECLCKEVENPNKIFSRYFNAEDAEKPFYLLSLFSNARERREQVSLREIVQMVASLPAPLEYTFDQQKDVVIPLNYLLKKELIYKIHSNEDIDIENNEMEENNYCLTDSGASLTGFIIRQDDFEKLLFAVERAMYFENICIGDLFYAILSGEEMRHIISNSIGNLYKMQTSKFVQMMKGIAKQLWTERAKFSMQIKLEITQILGVNMTDEAFDMAKFQVKKADGRCNILRVTAALLYRISPYCTAKKMYNRFEIGYSQIQKLAEQISYRLDIAKFSVPVIRTQDGRTMRSLFGRERVESIQNQIEEASNAVYFQLPLKKCRELNLQVTDPESAVIARRLIRIYTTLMGLTKKVKSGKELSKDDKRTIQKCKEKVSRLSDIQKIKYDAFWEVL